MADAGAWQSGVYDNGRDFHHGEKGPSPATGVPAAGLYNPTVSMGRSKEGAAWTITSITLRCVTILCTTIAFAIIASNKGFQSYYCPVGYKNCWFMWKSLNDASIAYLLAIDVIVCFYSIVQLILSMVSVCTGKSVLKGPLSPAATTTFICDQILTYMLVGGCGAGSLFAQDSVAHCEYVGAGARVFCDKNHASVALSFIASLCIALSAGMAYFRLYRLRG